MPITNSAQKTTLDSYIQSVALPYIKKGDLSLIESLLNLRNALLDNDTCPHKIYSKLRERTADWTAGKQFNTSYYTK